MHTLIEISRLKRLFKNQSMRCKEVGAKIKVPKLLRDDEFYNPINYVPNDHYPLQGVIFFPEEVLVKILTLMNPFYVRKFMLVSKNFARFVFQLDQDINGMILL